MFEAQWVDRDVSPVDYRQFGDNLLVTKVFYTLQGEGPCAGVPSVFVRLSGCNRGSKKSCPWCDTFFKFDAGLPQPPTEVLEYAGSLVPDTLLERDIPPILVLTGGEPMLQKNITAFTELVERSPLFDICQIESNGDFLRPISETTLLVVSPKVSPITGRYEELRPDVFERANCLKFVVSADPGSPYHSVPKYTVDFARRENPETMASPVYISPQTVYKRPVAIGEVASIWNDDLIDREQTRLNHKHAARLCLETGFCLSMQKHLYLELE